MTQKKLTTEVLEQGIEPLPDSLSRYSWWFQSPRLRYLALRLLVVSLVSANTGFCTIVLNDIPSNRHWVKLVSDPLSIKLRSLQCTTAFGTILSSAITSILSDRYGRLKLIKLGLIISIIGSIIQGTSTGWGMFFISRMIIGFAIGLYQAPAVALLAEISFPGYTGPSIASYGTSYHFGALISSWTVFGLSFINGRASWKIPSFLQIMPASLVFILLRTVPESPRFLVSKGRLNEAKAVLTLLHTEFVTGSAYSKDDELLLIMASINYEHEKETTLPLMRRIMCINKRRLFYVAYFSLLLLIFGNGLTTTYLFKYMSIMGLERTSNMWEVNNSLMATNFVTVALVNIAIGFFKRRILYRISLSGTVVVFLAWTIFQARLEIGSWVSKPLSVGAFTFTLVYSLVYFIGLSGLPYVLILEMSPYFSRTTNLAIMQVLVLLVAIFTNYVNPIAISKIAWKYYIIFNVVYGLLVAVSFFLFPETSGLLLEEASKIFEPGRPVLALDLKITTEHLTSASVSGSS